MKITFPPDDPSEAGTWRNSRQYEALPNVFPVVTYLMVIWCVAAHFMAHRAGVDGDIAAFHLKQDELGSMNLYNPWGEPAWKYLTSCFLHAGSGLISIHLIFNMMWLFQLGPLMERGLGSMKFLLFVVATGFVSSTYGTSLEGSGIGMSGVVYAMVGFMWTAWPRWTGFLERFRGSTVKFMLFWQVLVILMAVFGETNISIAAHMSGMVLGALIGLWACHGNRYGMKWLAGSLAFTAIGVATIFWSPWSEFYRYNKMTGEQFESLSISEQVRYLSWLERISETQGPAPATKFGGNLKELMDSQ